MVLDNKSIREAIEKALEEKGKRKFKQTVEMAVNFRGVDFTKPENRINVEVPLPHGRGKDVKVAVFADGQAAVDAKKAGADLVIHGEDIEGYGKNKAKFKKLANEYVFLAEPKLMMLVGRHLGQVLGVRGKMPKPLVGKDFKPLIDRARRVIILKTKGKYMPVLHAPVGTEEMEVDKLVENAQAIIEAIKNKVSDSNIKNVYFKLTMGKAIKVG